MQTTIILRVNIATLKAQGSGGAFLGILFKRNLLRAIEPQISSISIGVIAEGSIIFSQITTDCPSETCEILRQELASLGVSANATIAALDMATGVGRYEHPQQLVGSEFNPVAMFAESLAMFRALARDMMQ